MAIGKWTLFGATQNTSTNHTVVAVQPPVISSADAKQFGFENFGNTWYVLRAPTIPLRLSVSALGTRP
ncbi:hypothetical protein AcW1_001417 [Taiwanofungus camphoratus]|nr:hypothetical protein AcW2_000053 [Antrodia cinnamomea]KAI0937433.1 hypothetical protein AcV5_005344 [Antrodia cinnamomea]KAI0962644.1 hypothetical protein AcV7_001442 [Antrodia cinnamomea]KAI0964646.1 hypothetical protein AcW1_001417 [Antrodia cinnamomea]